MRNQTPLEREKQKAWTKAFEAYMLAPINAPTADRDALRVAMEAARQAVIDAGFKPE